MQDKGAHREQHQMETSRPPPAMDALPPPGMCCRSAAPGRSSSQEVKFQDALAVALHFMVRAVTNSATTIPKDTKHRDCIPFKVRPVNLSCYKKPPNKQTQTHFK